MTDTFGSDYDRSAAGMDFDDRIREKAESIGSRIADEGPGAILDEIENLVPEPVREQVANFPVVAVLLGIGVGIFLGMKKGDEVIAAGTAMLTATAASNFGKFTEQMGRG